MNTIPVKLGGKYRCTAEYADGSEYVSEWSDNLFLNQGIDRLLGTVENTLMTCVVGHGDTPVEPTDTQMADYAGQASRATPADNIFDREWVELEIVDDFAYVSLMSTYFFFTAGEGSGLLGTIREAGISTNLVSQLYSRTVLEEGIPVGVGTRLKIEYKFTAKVSLLDIVTEAEIDGVMRTITLRPAFLDTSSAWGRAFVVTARTQSASWDLHVIDAIAYPEGAIGDAYSGPSSSALNYRMPVTIGSYTDGQFYLDYTFSATGAGGLGAVTFSCSMGTWQIGIEPPLSITEGESVDFTVRLQIASAEE